MTEETFTGFGKTEAIELLYKGSGFRNIQTPSFTSRTESIVCSASKTLIEGIDFDLTYFPLTHLGYKSVVAVTGELHASMSHPRLLSVRIGVSAKLDFSHISELWKGITAAAKEQGCTEISLDLTPSPNGLMICLAATGEKLRLTAGRTVKARSKDLICVSGSLGAAFIGQQILEKEKHNFLKAGADAPQPDLEKYRMLVGSYLKPELSPVTVSALEEAQIYPSHGYFVSCGLSDAVKRLVRDSGLGAKIYAERIPFEGNSFAAAKELGLDPVSAAMSGGDDFRLLFTIPILSLEKFRKDFQTFDIIGHLAQSEVGAVLVTPDGAELPIRAQGWKE